MKHLNSIRILFLFIATIILVIHVHGKKIEEENEGMEFELDSDGNIIRYKKIKVGDEEEESTFKPDFIEDDGIPAELEENGGRGIEEEITISHIEEEEDDDNNEGEDGFLGNFITVHMGDFIHHPYEHEAYLQEDEPVITESVEGIEDNKTIVENEGELPKKEKREVEKEEEPEEPKEPEESESSSDESEVSSSDEENEEGEAVFEVEVVMDEAVIVASYNDMKEFFKTNDRMVLGCFDSLEREEYLNFRNASVAVIGNAALASENYFNGDELKFVTMNDKQCRNIIKRFTGWSLFKNSVLYCIYHRCYEYPTPDLTNFQKLKSFIDSKEIPVISEYHPEQKDIYQQWNTHFLIYLNDDENQTQADLAGFLSEIADDHRQDFVVMVSKDQHFNIDTLDEPRDHNLLIFAPEFQTLYSIQEILDPEDAIDKVSATSFIRQYMQGVLTPRIVYQDFERMWDFDNYVVQSVPRYYYPHVLNPLRDSLVVYYKADCPFSQEAIKTFEKLGRKYADYRTKFSVVKYEAEDQKIPRMSLWRKLEAYPTIVLYKANPLSREKKDYFVYPDEGGRSSVSLDKWIQAHSFYKPSAIFTDEDYKEKEVLDADAEEIEDNEEEEERINRLLEDPSLIFTRYGYGKEIQEVSDDEDEDSGQEEAEYFFDNVNTKTDIPITGTYYELLSTTYVVKTSNYTPPPSLYDDDNNNVKGDDEDEDEDEE